MLIIHCNRFRIKHLLPEYVSQFLIDKTDKRMPIANNNQVRLFPLLCFLFFAQN